MVILVLLLFGAYRGYKKGLMMEVIAILAFILAIIGSFKLLHAGMDFLDRHFEISGKLLPYIAFIVIFIVIIILVNMLGKWIKKLLDMTLLGSFDNVAGAIIGILKWAFGISVLIWITISFDVNLSEKWSEGALLYPWVEAFAPKVVQWISSVFPFLEGLYDMVREMLSGTGS